MVEPSASLIPHDDPNVWINAGVAALKKYFDGTEKPAVIESQISRKIYSYKRY